MYHFHYLFHNNLYFIIKIFKITIFDNRTEIINIFGKKTLIINNNILFSEEYYRKEKRDGITHTLKLEIKFPNKNIIIYKDEEPNYDKLIACCKEKYKRSNDKNINYRFYIIPILIFF